MSFRPVIPGLRQLDLSGIVNCFLLETKSGNLLIDCGLPEHGPRILEALEGRPLAALLLTHAHPDHAGAAAFLRQETGAPVWCHPLEAELLESGKCLRPLQASPGLLNRYLCKKFVEGGLTEIPACEVNSDLSFPELELILTPGHSAGHVCFLWKEKRALVLGDAAANVGWLRPSIVHEDYVLGLESVRLLAGLSFDVAVFGHGAPITKNADRRLRGRFGQAISLEDTVSIPCDQQGSLGSS